MLVADPTTGYLHEVPEYAGWSGYGEPEELGWYGAGWGEADPYAMGYAQAPVAYDGFGNPVGALPALAALAPLALKALPMVASALPGLLKSFLGNPQLGYLPGYGYPGAGGLGYYAEPQAFEGYYGEPEAYQGYYAEPYVDPAIGYAGYSQPAVPQQIVYDGFGNPVGAFPALAALAPLAAKILPAVLPAIPSLLSSLFGGKRKKARPVAPGLGGWGEAGFDGYGYYGAPGYSLGYAPAWGAAPAGQVVYDGFGNPVGAFPALASLVSRIVPAVTSAIPKVTGLIQRVLPHARRVAESLVSRGLGPAVPVAPVTPLMATPVDAGGDGPEPQPVVPVTPVTPVAPVTPIAPVAPVPLPYPSLVRVPGSPQDIAYCRQLLRGAGGGLRRRRRPRRRRG
jgi:hypothetical protein